MKTFAQLTVGDKIFQVTEGSMRYDTHQVTKVEDQSLRYRYGDDLKRGDDHSRFIKKYGDDRRIYLTTSEADAIRYCKAQLMKDLFNKIAGAKKAIADVVKFKQEHYELLQHQWTENSINQLEREANQL